jgi:hypothetical protein
MQSRDAGQDEAGTPAGEGRLGVGLLVAVTLALQGVSWRILEGYQVADSVEFVENAQALVRGHEVLDSQAIRSAFFPLLLSPPLLLADLFGLEDQRPLFWLMRLVQMGIGVAVVLAAAGLGRRVAGRGAGLLAGWTVAVNPVFLQYTVSPLTDVLAALLVTLGLVALADAQKPRRGLWGGVWLGLAVMVSYKTLAMAAAAVAVLVLAGRWRGRRTWLEALGGLATCAVGQILLDWVTYGSPGHSLFVYVGANFGPLAGKLCYVPAGYLEELLPSVSHALKRAAVWLYSLNELLGEVESPATDPIKGRYPWHWYASSLHEWVVPSLLVGTLAGAWAALRGQARSLLVPLAACALYAAILSTKGWKDHRLLLVTLPTLAACTGVGLALARGTRSSWRALLVLGLVGWAGADGLDQLLARNTRKFSGYWDALAWIQDQELPEEEQRVAGAYHWALFMREAPGVTLTKLPHQLDGFGDLTADAQREDLFALVDQDWLVIHLPVLTHPEHQDLLRVVNRHFSVEALFWDHEDFEDIGPVLALRRRRGEPDERRFFERAVVDDPEAWRSAAGLPRPQAFVRPDLGEEVWFLGSRYEVLPGDGHGWLTTWHWCASERILADYQVIYRVTTHDERNSYQVNFQPAWGAEPTPTWGRGTLIRESYPVVAAAEPFAWQEPYRPMGGPYRRGDLMPARLWLDFVTFDADPETGAPFINARLELARPGTAEPLRTPEDGPGRLQKEGFEWSLEGHVRVGRFFLPVPPDARLPDDGRPVPD